MPLSSIYRLFVSAANFHTQFWCRVMLNVLGEADGEEGELAAKSLLDKAYGVSGKGEV